MLKKRQGRTDFLVEYALDDNPVSIHRYCDVVVAEVEADLENWHPRGGAEERYVPPQHPLTSMKREPK